MTHYRDNFSDYIQDIPMQLGTRFFPPSTVHVPIINLPQRLELSNLEYSFEAERLAIQQFEDNESGYALQNPPLPERSASKAVADQQTGQKEAQNFTSILMPNSVLQPSQPAATPPTSSNGLNTSVEKTSPHGHDFGEFETGINVFDEVEMRALDDRAALQEVLMTASSASTTPVIADTCYYQNILPQNSAPVPQPRSNKALEGDAAGKDKSTDLQARLQAKGYRKDIIELVLAKIPRNRLVHIEYYMKGARTMEKSGVAVSEGLDFLIGCSLEDKKNVLTYADSVARICSMGFNVSDVFDSVKKHEGDHTKALDSLLSNQK